MAHQFDSGMFHREPAWHRLGNVVEDYPGSWDEARKLAGIEWDPISEPIYALAGVDGDGNPRYEKIEGYYSVNRSDRTPGEANRVMSVQQDSYTLIDNGEVGQILEAVLDTSPKLHYETAGALAEGNMIWALVRLDEPFQIKGDFSATMPYVALTNRHDATGGCNLSATSVRIVCANTWKAQEMEAAHTGLTFSFRHVKSWKERIEDARQAITGARKEFREYEKLATELIGFKVTARQRELFVTEFVPLPAAQIVSDRVVNNVEQARQSIRLILESETTKPVADTAYGLVQAAGEYLDHVRKYRSSDTLLGRQLLKPQALKTRATNLAVQASQGKLQKTTK